MCTKELAFIALAGMLFAIVFWRSKNLIDALMTPTLKTKAKILNIKLLEMDHQPFAGRWSVIRIYYEYNIDGTAIRSDVYSPFKYWLGYGVFFDKEFTALRKKIPGDLIEISCSSNGKAWISKKIDFKSLFLYLINPLFALIVVICLRYMIEVNC
ncbi:hypothetical protein [Ottowia testudinis]|uniref:DUF3592 domain-containing protein n=1 Tax=Ottowia testudinis TaxID=2816950 RepID=A0A975CES4_9BURK|nr:hypothetical protein [Ottowia testudinis]QTD43721.1 hypothetical protein J1M35_11165 [Ottowia testudinis]